MQNIIGSSNQFQKNMESTPNQKQSSSVSCGLLLSFLSGVIYTVCGVVTKLMRNIHPVQLAMYQFLAVMTFALPEIVWYQKNVFGPKELQCLLITRAVCATVSWIIIIIAFRYLPIGEATVIVFSFPVTVTIAARIVLKESCGLIQIIPLCLTLIGLVFTLGIPDIIIHGLHHYTIENIYGIAAALGALLIGTCSILLVRKVKSVHHSVIMFNFGWVGILETAVLIPLVDEFRLHTCALQGGLIILLGTSSYLSQLLFTKALQCDQAGPVSTMRAASNIIFSFMWQTFLFREIPEASKIFGAVLVCSSVVLIGCTKWVTSLPEESALRKRFTFHTM